jgi:hypothetical protein
MQCLNKQRLEQRLALLRGAQIGPTESLQSSTRIHRAACSFCSIYSDRGPCFLAAVGHYAPWEQIWAG